MLNVNGQELDQKGQDLGLPDPDLLRIDINTYHMLFYQGNF